MKRFVSIFTKTFEIFASLELAVFTILTLAICLAIGTIYESEHGTEAAAFFIYRSWWMTLVLFLLFINVLSSALSRMPWKRNHIGFLITHLGILILIVGSLITRTFGLDGLLALSPGESSRLVRLEDKVLNIFRAQPNTAYDLLLTKSLHLFAGLKAPVEWQLNQGKVAIVNYYPKAFREVKAEPAQDGIPALKFQLHGSRASFSQWMFLHRKEGVSIDLGPAEIYFLTQAPLLQQKVLKNTLYVYLRNQKPYVAVVRKGEKRLKQLGEAKKNQAMALGWMDFSFILEEFFLKAAPQVQYSNISSENMDANLADSLVEAIEVEFLGERHWIELGSAYQMTKSDAIYYLQYANKQVDVGFDVSLKDFHIRYYEGTKQPKSYESTVLVAGKEHLISMNQPMVQNGITFYQSSYTTDDEGNPVASVLSVNKDPGRKTKYAGSLMIVLGIISMFYFKPVYSGNSRWFKR